MNERHAVKKGLHVISSYRVLQSCIQINIADFPKSCKVPSWPKEWDRWRQIQWRGKLSNADVGEKVRDWEGKDGNMGENLRRKEEMLWMDEWESIPKGDISGTPAKYGPSRNFGSLSLMSWTLTTNSDLGSTGKLVSRSTAWAWRV